MPEYIKNTKFPPYDTLTPQQGKEPKYHGHPNQGQKPWAQDDKFYHGEGKINPWMQTYCEPDGRRISVDPYCGVESREYPSGEHVVHHRGGNVHTVAGKRWDFTGGGGMAEAHGGMHDYSARGHHRENRTGDTYHHTAGSHHMYVAGHSVSVVKGNQVHEVNGKMKTRLVGEKSSHSISVGPGASSIHDNALTMTPKRIYHRASGKGDLWLDTASNTINQQAGTDHNTQAENNVSIHAKGDHVVIKCDKIHLDGDVIITGVLKVGKEIHAKKNIGTPKYLLALNVGDIPSPDQAPDTTAPAAATLSHGSVS
jgi:hypothetical protein